MFGVLALEPLLVSGDLNSGPKDTIRDDAARGWNGAALAALGEMMDFFGAEPLPDKSEGVKLGESTLNRFLLLFRVLRQFHRRSNRSRGSNTCPTDAPH